MIYAAGPFASLSVDSSSKIGHDFSKKLVQKLKLSIHHFDKKCAPKQLFFNENISKRFGRFLK
jgi:hypothetical protein